MKKQLSDVLAGKKGRLVATCTLCDSENVKREHHMAYRYDGVAEYHARYKCADCGAVAIGHEVWVLNEKAVD